MEPRRRLDVLLEPPRNHWRALDREQQSRVRDEASAIALMLERPTLIKRPVVETGDDVVVGFDASDYARRFDCQRGRDQ